MGKDEPVCALSPVCVCFNVVTLSAPVCVGGGGGAQQIVSLEARNMCTRGNTRCTSRSRRFTGTLFEPPQGWRNADAFYRSWRDLSLPMNRFCVERLHCCWLICVSYCFADGALSQDKLWEEMEGKEERGKKAQQAAKKNKKV